MKKEEEGKRGKICYCYWYTRLLAVVESMGQWPCAILPSQLAVGNRACYRKRCPSESFF